MKRSPTARSRRSNRQESGVSLFPFLAVLMCTMGALVVLLVVISRQAHLQAAEAARTLQDKSARTEEDLRAARELVQLQISQLKTSREKTETQLADARLQLGHIEDHMRRLRDQLVALQSAGSELNNLDSSRNQQRQQLLAELQRLQNSLAEARQRLADAQQAALKQPKSFAVVPYQGPNETRRRPIYLECCEDAVILQPEGIRFTADDFSGPLGPGNPLEAALRATREYLLATHAIPGDGSAEPYPLLLVRPDGIATYYDAMAAMRSWNYDFGYEMIDEEWKLKFDQPDPRLAEVVRQTVDMARLRQQRLAEVAPRCYGNGSATSSSSSQPVYRASPTRGGVVIDGANPSAQTGTIIHQTRPSGMLSGDSGSSSSSSQPVYRASPTRGGVVIDGANPAAQTGTITQQTRPSGMLSGDSGSSEQAPAAIDREGVIRRPDRTPNPDEPAPDKTNVALRPGEWVPYQRPDRPSSAPQNADQKPEDRRKPPDRSQSADAANSAAGSKSADDAKSTASSASANGGKQPEHDQQPPSDQQSSAHHDASLRSLAETRGPNWGLPGAPARCVPITRPIHLECYTDRFVLPADQGRGRAREIPLRSGTRDSVDDVVSAVWDRMDSWGIAGRDMYWKPILKVYVTPGGEGRFKDLQALLKDSGLEVQQITAPQ